MEKNAFLRGVGTPFPRVRTGNDPCALPPPCPKDLPAPLVISLKGLALSELARLNGYPAPSRGRGEAEARPASPVDDDLWTLGYRRSTTGSYFAASVRVEMNI